MPSSRLMRAGGISAYLGMTTPAAASGVTTFPTVDFTPSVENTPGLITLLGNGSFRINVPGVYFIGCTFNTLNSGWTAQQGQRVLVGITRNGNGIMRANLPDVVEDVSPSYQRMCRGVTPSDVFAISVYQTTGAARQFQVNIDVTRVA